jgi:photosystem II stability/assembly factor-like uncharacterized protein
MKNAICKLVLITAACLILLSGGAAKGEQGQWEPRGLANEPVEILKINSSGTIFAGGNKLFRSTNNGQSWAQLQGPGTGKEGVIRTLDINRFDNTLYASTGNGVYTSRNNGERWEMLLMSSKVYAVASNDAGDIFVYLNTGDVLKYTGSSKKWEDVLKLQPGNEAELLITAQGHIFLSSYSEGLYRSTNNGKTWDKIGMSFDYPLCTTALTVNPANGTIYAADHFNGMLSVFYNVYMSADNGESWTKIKQDVGKVSSITADTRTGVIVSTDMVYRTTDNGKTWELLNEGLPKSLRVTSLAVSPEGSAFAGSFGVFRHSRTTSVVGEYVNGYADDFFLEQNYPNPFNPVTSIKYRISKGGFVKLYVYDVAGRETAMLVSKYQAPGEYSINFDAAGLAGGVYFYKLEANGYSDIRKMTLLK